MIQRRSDDCGIFTHTFWLRNTDLVFGSFEIAVWPIYPTKVICEPNRELSNDCEEENLEVGSIREIRTSISVTLPRVLNAFLR